MSQENKTTLDESSVTAGAKAADPQQKLQGDGSSLGGVIDLGGPTPENSRPTDDSNKYKIYAGGNPKPPTTKPSAASGDKQDSFKTRREEEEVEGEVISEEESDETESIIEVDMSADVAALTEGEDLSEEFKEKARVIFEAAVVSRLNEELEHMHEEYARALETEIETVKTELAEAVDEYLSYSVVQWADKNSIAIEHGIKTEMAAAVMNGLKKVFVENFIEIPDEKVDVLEEVQSQLLVMETKLNESIEENIELYKYLGNYIKNGIVAEIAEGLSLTQREKLTSLAEAVEFDNEDTFRTKVSTLRESYFSTKPEVTSMTEDVKVENGATSDAMSVYVQAMSRWGK